MPKTTTITKEMIINSTFEIVREEGFYNLSARKIAKKIGCSTQPIYWVYKSIDDLIRDVVNKVVSYLSEMLKSYQKSGKPFLDYGLGYVYIAHTEPVFFKAIYVDNILCLKMTDLVSEKEMLDLMKQDSCCDNIADDKLLEIATNAWFLAHGMASLIASKVLVYDEEKVEKMLELFMGQ